MSKYEGHTPGDWTVRAMPDGDTGYEPDTFVEAPQAKGMAYGLDVCGDDYTGYGGVKVRNANMRLIADAPKLARENEELRKALRRIEGMYYGIGIGVPEEPNNPHPGQIARAALESTEPEVCRCRWSIDEAAWVHDCGMRWYLLNDPPTQAIGANYCPKCGKPLEVVEEENDE